MNEVLEIKLSNDGRITSVELCELINVFRIEEGNETKLLHKTLLESIRTEVEALKKADISSEQNFLPTYYDDLQGKQRPCFSLSDNGVLEMLNKESAVVRYKTVEYIKKLKLAKQDSYMIEDPAERARRWAEEYEERRRLSEEVNIKNQLIGELKPKADYTDTILKSKDLVTITQISKDYGMTGQEMNKLLYELGVQYKESGQWLLYRDYQSMGYTMSETVPITYSNGMQGTKMHTKWTQKGRLFLYQTLKENGYIPLIEQDIAS